MRVITVALTALFSFSVLTMMDEETTKTKWKTQNKKTRIVHTHKESVDVIARRIRDSLTGGWDELLAKIIDENIKNGKSKELKKALSLACCDGLTPLQYILLRKHPPIDTIKLLIKAGAKTTQRLNIKVQLKKLYTDNEKASHTNYHKGWNLLAIAFRSGCNQDILQLLSEQKLDIFGEDKSGWRPIDVAFFYQIDTAVDFILKNYNLLATKMPILNEKLVNDYIERKTKNFSYSHTKGFYSNTNNIINTLLEQQEPINNGKVTTKNEIETDTSSIDNTIISNINSASTANTTKQDKSINDKEKNISITTPKQELIPTDNTLFTKKKLSHKNKPHSRSKQAPIIFLLLFLAMVDSYGQIGF